MPKESSPDSDFAWILGQSGRHHPFAVSMDRRSCRGVYAVLVLELHLDEGGTARRRLGRCLLAQGGVLDHSSKGAINFQLIADILVLSLALQLTTFA